MTEETEILPVSTVAQAEIVEPRKTRKNGKALAPVEAAPAPATAPAAPSLLAILQAVMTDPTASIERMNQAFDFYQRLEAASARKAFEAAMAAAKAEFDPIVKRHVVSYGKGDGATSYKHEDLADIEAAVKPALSKHGLSYRWRVTSNPSEPVRVTCIVTHEEGHFEETTLSAGADNTGGKNSIQGIGSTLTYLQRYTLKPALGLAAGRDDDGRGANGASEAITDEQFKALNDKLDATGSDKARFCKYFKIDGVALLPAARYAEAMKLLNQKATG